MVTPSPVEMNTPPGIPCWGGLPMGTHGREDYYCEANRASCVAQPANTWSSLVYLLTAALVAKKLRGRMAGCTRGERAAVIVVLVECALLAPASAIYHAALTRSAERFDMSGTYGVVAAMLALTCARFLGPRGDSLHAATTLVALVIAAHTVAAFFKYRIDDDIVFPVLLGLLVLAFVVLARTARAASGQVALGALSAGVAGALRILDVNKTLCAPRSWLQGHAAWHLLTSAAIGLGLLGLFPRRVP